MTEGGKSGNLFITDLKEKLLKNRTEEFAAKYVEKQVQKHLIQFYNESNQEKQKILKAEKQQLEKVRDQMYNLENDFCDTVWKFSREHDFGNFLINYPRVKKPPACDCDFYKENVNTIEKELEDNAEIQKVTREVDALRLEFETLSNAKNLEEEIKKASEELKYAPQEDPEIQRLIKVLQNSQQELEDLQSEIENIQKKDTLSEKLEIVFSPEVIKKKRKKNEKTSKHLKFVKKSPRVDKNLPLSFPNTIDNYLIIKGNKISPVIDKKWEESQIITGNENKDKSGIPDSWSLISADGFSITEIKNSIKDTYNFLESTKKLTVQELLSGNSKLPSREDLKKSKVFATIECPELNSMIKERKSMPRAFTPKKQSAISEKLLGKH
ncbi:triadin-like [Belonocnema kinseyi]|uniref:triadin-like n=1 Tax=Belonocnema kinseyi TaxID=2817044 RepID=UPI00143D2152|nr:triadin-like [Belonocnema kinseyi]